MTKKSALLRSVLILILTLGGATTFLLIVWPTWSERSLPAPLSAVFPPPEAPATIMISCERGKKFGWTSYPDIQSNTMSDLAPEPAIFARCRPDENFTYDIQSTRAEIMDASRRPEIAFVLAEEGQVRFAVITRSSGSKSLDLKVLSLVADRHYKATPCGACRVFAAPPVDLKKY